MAKIKHHFLGKECLIDRELSNYSNIAKHLKSLDFNYRNQPLFTQQIHSNKVAIIDNINKIYSANNKPKADALVTNLKNITLCIVTADCVPILFFDQTNSIIAIAHAGWKGTKNGIIAATISHMLQLGAQTNNITCLIGPSIRQQSYQVSNQFYQNFIAEELNNKKFFIPDKKISHFMFDLPSYVKAKLSQEGIKNISDKEIDTYSNPNKLFSYRRSSHSGEKDCGRNISVIMIS